jgi:hypothetical protein
MKMCLPEGRHYRKLLTAFCLLLCARCQPSLFNPRDPYKRIMTGAEDLLALRVHTMTALCMSVITEPVEY